MTILPKGRMVIRPPPRIFFRLPPQPPLKHVSLLSLCVSLRLEHAGGSRPEPHVRAVGRLLFGGTYNTPEYLPGLCRGSSGGVKTLRPVWLTPVPVARGALVRHAKRDLP